MQSMLMYSSHVFAASHVICFPEPVISFRNMRQQRRSLDKEVRLLGDILGHKSRGWLELEGY